MFKFKSLSALNEDTKWQNKKSEYFNYSKKVKSRQFQWCNSVAIHPIFQLMLIASDDEIKLLSLISINGQIKVLNKFKSHTLCITCLQFFTKTNQFVSASEDSQIKIWKKDLESWTVQTTLVGHQDLINCLVVNDEETLIISGSSDHCIKFWEKTFDWHLQQTIQVQNIIYSLSLSEFEDKLISCGQDGLILVFEKQIDNWIQIQQINHIVGTRLLFITQNLFTFQPANKDVVQIFEFDCSKKTFQNTNQIQIQKLSFETPLFPQQFIKSKQILMSKIGNCINLIQKNENQFSTDQSIVFRSHHLFGAMNHEGSFLITWDDNSKDIEIRKYRKLK